MHVIMRFENFRRGGRDKEDGGGDMFYILVGYRRLSRGIVRTMIAALVVPYDAEAVKLVALLSG